MELKDKEAFFAAYYGGEVIVTKGTYTKPMGTIYALRYDILDIVHHSTFSKVRVAVHLKSLSDITDEDALTLSCYLGNVIDLDDFIQTNSKELVLKVVSNYTQIGLLKHLPSSFIDKARSMGYLTPYNGYDIQQILDLGWAKLKTK